MTSQLLDLLDDVKDLIPDKKYLEMCQVIQRLKTSYDQVCDRLNEYQRKERRKCKVCTGDLPERLYIPDFHCSDMTYIDGDVYEYSFGPTTLVLGPDHRHVTVYRFYNGKFVIKVGGKHQRKRSKARISPVYNTLREMQVYGYIWITSLT